MSREDICDMCSINDNCAYRIRNLEEMCDKIAYWEDGYEESIIMTCEWLYQRQMNDLEVNNIEKFINDYKKYMKI